MHTIYRKGNIFICVLLVFFTALGCTLPALQKSAQPTPEPVLETPTRESSPVPPTKTPAPTATVTLTPLPKPKDLALSSEVALAQVALKTYAFFVVENPDPALAVTSSSYQIIFYDAQGSTLGDTSGNIGILYPGEKRGIGLAFEGSGTKAPSRAEVKLKTGDPLVVKGTKPPLPVEQANFFEIGNFTGTNMQGAFYSVTGLIRSSLDVDINNMEVAALGFGEDGKIVGGGTGKIDFLTAGGHAAVQIQVYTLEKNLNKIHWEVYPNPGELDSAAKQGEAEPALRVVDQGFGQTEEGTGVAFLIENTDKNMLMQDALYRATAYDKAGKVLDTETSSLNLVFPGETAAFYADLTIPRNRKADHVEIDLKPGKLVKYELAESPFTTGEAKFSYDPSFPKVNGIVTNTLGKEISSVAVIAVAFDKAGKIIGGGSTHLSSVPASGKAPVEITVTVKSGPARVALYASLATFSEIGK
jgi:hypothetical protein